MALSFMPSHLEDGTWSMANGTFETRRADGTISNGREPLDVDALFSHLKEDDRLDVPIPAETRVGHMHLHIRNVDEAVDFYHGLIGFDMMGVAKPFRGGVRLSRWISPSRWTQYLAGRGRASAAGRCNRIAALYS